ncbi:MAG: Tic20 family protein [Gloeomargarita sp. HHBFW_bins_162]
MTWRSSTTPVDRIFASLVYLIPLYNGIVYGRFLFDQFPVLNYIKYPLIPLAIIYGLIPFGLGSLLVFIALFVGVVRNEKIPHFIRFNTMQAILISILLSLIGLIYSFILEPIIRGFITEVLFNTIFLGVIAAVGYSIFQSAQGRYAEIPVISEASYLQTR